MKIIIFGSGGHSRVVTEIVLKENKHQLIGFIDPLAKNPNEKIFNLPILGGFESIPKVIKMGVKGFVVGVGNNKIRAKRFQELINSGLTPIKAIHPTADIGKEAKIGEGSVVSLGAIIATQSKIGKNSIINSGAIVEHEAQIGNHVHIAPGAALAGRVKVKDYAFLGLRSVVKDYITIEEKAIVGAGAVVINNVKKETTVVGIPAKKIKIVADE